MSESGIFNGKSTGEEVAAFWKDRCKGLSILLTGATSGIGLQTVKDLLKYGASVIATGTTKERCNEALSKIKEACGEDADITFLELKLDNFESVRKMAEAFRALNKPLNVLINNAGVCNAPWSHTAQGLEYQFATNYLGHFLLTLLLPPADRVVNVSSSGHQMFVDKRGVEWASAAFQPEKGYDAFSAYGKSKYAQVLHSMALSQRNTLSVSLCPGGVAGTQITRHHSAFYWLFQNPIAAARHGNLKMLTKLTLKSIERSSSTLIYAALCPDIEAGGYYVDCKRTDCHPAANVEEATKLWEWTENFLRENEISTTF